MAHIPIRIIQAAVETNPRLKSEEAKTAPLVVDFCHARTYGHGDADLLQQPSRWGALLASLFSEMAVRLFLFDETVINWNKLCSRTFTDSLLWSETANEGRAPCSF
jgi:hypothetical protein